MLPIFVFDNKRSNTFEIDGPAGGLELINVSTVLVGSSSSANPNLKVGDTVYVIVSFQARDFQLKGKPVTVDDIKTDYFLPFFKFKTKIDAAALKVKFLEGTGPSKHTTNRNVYTTWGLTYALDLSGLASGDKEIQLFSTDDDGKEVLIGTSPSFYLNQSLAELFQKNIANGGVAGSRIGLDRDNVNFPAYLPVGLQPINPMNTPDVSFWTAIKNGTEALSFKSYAEFMDFLFCGGINPFDIETEGKFRDKLVELNKNRSLPFNNVDAYRVLKVATEAFVMGSIEVFGVPDVNFVSLFNNYLQEVKQKTGSPQKLRILPYLALIRQKLPDLDFKASPFEQTFLDYLDSAKRDSRLLETCFGLVSAKLQFPCFVELIWNYWTEESMMVQGLNSIARRFQNIRGEGAIDPLANLEIGPLRPLNNLMWGYVQDAQHRLTVRRRAYEYDHHYGMTLQGTAVNGLRPADSRSKFIEAFHTLLNLTVKFYHQYDDTTVVADGFPLMNALKEVHMILSEGAHNQFGDLPSTARIEMLMEQYILARPEFREFLPTRQMVAYPEPWMDRVAVLNQMHNWTKTNVMHFRDLAKYGEQIILSIRFGAWSDVINRDQAANWAIFWRAQIQNYMHAYRAVTGVDLTREDGVIDAQQPSIHLLRRLNEQNARLRV